MNINDLGTAALNAILDGTNVTLTIIPGKKPFPGWPRGELLCVTDHGHNYSYDPIKVLKFMQNLIRERNQ